MLESKIVADLSTEPVTLAEVKTVLVIDSGYTADDTLLTAFIVSARQLLEKYTNLSFGEKTLKAYTDKNYLDLPYGPITAVTNVVDQDGNEIPEADYKLRGLDFKKIYIGAGNLDVFYPLGGGPPIIDGPVIQRYYTISYTAGYTALPEALKLAIKEQVREMYNTRGVSPSEPGLTAKILADPYCRRSWI